MSPRSWRPTLAETGTGSLGFPRCRGVIQSRHFHRSSDLRPRWRMATFVDGLPCGRLTLSPEEVCFLTTVHTLASGSSGNALLLSCGETLYSAGCGHFLPPHHCRLCGSWAWSSEACTAILITHTHADHISGLQTLLKRCAAPVFTTERAARELSWRLPGAEHAAGRAGLRHPPVYRRVCRDGISHIP